MPKLVLIIENEQEYRQLLQQVVEGLGYRALAVNKAIAGLQALASEMVSLILLDLKMAGVHGEDFLRVIRKRGKRTPVVVVSGYLNPEVLEILRDNHVHQVIQKPFRIQRLAQAVNEVLADG